MQLVIEHFAATRVFFLFSRMLLGWCHVIWELPLKIWQQNQSKYQEPKAWLYFRTFAAKQRSSYTWVFCHCWLPHGGGISTREVCVFLALIILFAKRLDTCPWHNLWSTPAIPSCQKEAFPDIVSNPEGALSSGIYLWQPQGSWAVQR